MDMELANISENSFVFRGTCPHCGDTATFPTVTKFVIEESHGQPDRIIAAARCIGCREYILAIIQTVRDHGSYSTHWAYEAHYPVGKPGDTVPDEIPEPVAVDFKEAIRCQFVDAYNATVEMCRRATETSCLDLGAPFNDVLEDMIDWLETQRIITPSLRDVAHKVRLSGNRGAHPWNVGQTIAKPIPIVVIEKEHAEAVLSFTWHFLEHVYVIPQRLPKFDFSKPKAEKK